MTRVQVLKHEAKQVATTREHALSPWKRDRLYTNAFYARCTQCDADVSVIPYDGYEIFGVAVAVNCSHHKGGEEA